MNVASLRRTLTNPRVAVPLAVALAAVVLRCVVIAKSVGSNDMVTWRLFADHIRDHGLLATYRDIQDFNHPPLMGLWARLCLAVNDANLLSFPHAFKLLPLAADLLAAYLLARIARERRLAISGPWLAALFLLNPLSILVGAYHGNTDNAMAALCLLAAYFASRDRPALAGLVLAGAMNVKLPPIYVLPPLFLFLRDWRSMLRFSAAFVVGLAPIFVIAGLEPAAFYRNAIAYNSMGGRWGISFFIVEPGAGPRLTHLVSAFGEPYWRLGRYIIAGAVVGLGALVFRGRRSNALEVAALALALFLVLAPGFGVQYLTWVAPLLFAVSVREGLSYTLLAGTMLFLTYFNFWTGDLPAYSKFDAPVPMQAALFGLLAWQVLVRFVAKRLVAIVRSPVAASTESNAAPAMTAVLGG